MLEIIDLIFIFHFEQPTKSRTVFVHHYFSTRLTFLKKENARKKSVQRTSQGLEPTLLSPDSLFLWTFNL
jgi:hypothetical protein